MTESSTSMGAVKRILCATDFSDCACRALGYAINLAMCMEAQLHVIHGLQAGKSDTGRGPDLERQVIAAHLGDEVQRLLDTRFSTAVEPPEIHCTVIRRDAVPATIIIDHAAEIGADMIVLGTRGEGGVKRLFLGSVAEKVVRNASCPVLTVQRDSDLPPINNILVPVDFTDATSHVLRQAKALADALDARLELMHIVLDPRPPDFYEDEMSWLSNVDAHTSELAEQKLKKEFSAMGGDNVAVNFHVRNGHPAKEIVRFIDEHSCDLVVMSTSGLQGFVRFLAGSIAEEVIRKATALSVNLFEFNIFIVPL